MLFVVPEFCPPDPISQRRLKHPDAESYSHEVNPVTARCTRKISCDGKKLGLGEHLIRMGCLDFVAKNHTVVRVRLVEDD